MPETLLLSTRLLPYFSAVFAFLAGLKVLRASRVMLPPPPAVNEEVTSHKINQLMLYLSITSRLNKRAAIYAMISAGTAWVAWITSADNIRDFQNFFSLF